MPIVIAKDAGSGPGGDKTYTINNFSSLAVDIDMPAEVLYDLAGDDQAALLMKFMGMGMKVDFDYTLEGSNADTGGAGTLTAIADLLFLADSLRSSGPEQYNDKYTLTLDFGGGSTLVRTGVLTKINCVMSESEPITFEGHITFQVGTVV